MRSALFRRRRSSTSNNQDTNDSRHHRGGYQREFGDTPSRSSMSRLTVRRRYRGLRDCLNELMPCTSKLRCGTYETVDVFLQQVEFVNHSVSPSVAVCG